MRSTAEEAMTRVLVAAASEFAQYGLAGGRIDRISVAAGVSKERLYVYFGSKQALWSTVMSGVVQELDQIGAVDSLDGTAIVTRLFDHFVGHPDHLRLFYWHAVEEDLIADADDPRARLHQRKVALVSRAQAEGRVDSALPAEVVVHLLITVAANCARQWLADPQPLARRDLLRSAAGEVGGRVLR